MNKKIASILIFVLILSGCAGQRDRGSGTSDTASETSPEESIPVASWEEYGMSYTKGLTRLVGDIVYTTQWEFHDDNTLKATKIIRQRRGDKEGEVILSLDGRQWLCELLADEEESVYILYSEQSEDGEVCFIRKDDSMGNMVYCEAVPLTPYEFRVDMGITGPGGEVVFCTYEGAAYFFDSQGKLAREVVFEWDGWDGSGLSGQTAELVNAENRIYLCQVVGKMVRLREVDMENASFGSMETIAMETTSVDINGNMLITLFSGYEKGLLLSLDNTLWRYSPGTGKKETVLNWGDKHINLKGSSVDEIGVLKDGSLYILTYDYSVNATSLILIQERAMDKVDDIDTIVIGCVGFSINELLEDVVVEFNRENKEYVAEIRVYSDILELQLDLIKGEGPDVFDVSNLPKEMLTSKGITEDLSPYFKASSVVKESDLLPSVREAGYADGMLAYVIPSFILEAYIVEKGYVEDYGWTADEFFALADKYPNGMLTGMTPEAMFFNILSAEIGSFIDWERQECSFNSEQFVNFLESLKGSFRGSEGSLGYSELLHGGNGSYFYNKEVLVYSVQIQNVTYWGYLHIKEAFLDYGELIGLPNPEGKPLYRMNPDRAFAINSATGKKEGAWGFLEFLLSEKYQTNTFTFPARSDAFESWLETHPELDNKYTGTNPYTGNEFTEWPEYTDADRDFMRFMVDNAYWDESTSLSVISSVLMEETSAFFAGDKTARDAVDIIQSRISLYLKE